MSIQLPSWVIPVKELAETENTKNWCFLPYHNHAKGCPNACGRCWGASGRRKMVMLSDVIDFDKPIYIVYNEFNLDKHVMEMRTNHPDWTEPQLRNSRYWQEASRSALRKRIKEFLSLITPKPDLIVDGENMGVNLYKTCLLHGLKLDPISKMKICRHMVIIGYRKNGRKIPSNRWQELL
jgi:hypothetical protein